jgi:hypothetical protein
MSDIPEARDEGFYWVVLGQNPPEIAYWERSEWWLCGEGRPVAALGGDRRKRPAGVQASVASGGVIRFFASRPRSVAGDGSPPSTDGGVCGGNLRG